MKRTLAVTGFTMLGTLLVFCNIPSLEAISVAILTAFIVLLFSLIIKVIRTDGTLPTAIISVIVALTVLLVTDINYNKNAVLYNGKEITVSGSLTCLPYKQNGRSYYIIKTQTVNGEEKKLNIRIVSSSPIDFEPTDTVTAKVKVFLLGADDDTYLNYYKSKDLTFGAYPVGGVKTEKNVNLSPMQIILLLRSKMTNEILNVLPNDYGAVIAGLVLGDKTNLSERAENAFRFCGVSHLFAVSGLHVTVWSMLFFQAIKKLRFSVKKASAVSILFCIFFMALTGFNPPVVRAGIMLILVYSANFFDREADAVNSIGLALTIMLISNPYNALSVSLLLSLLATMGILVLAAPLADKIMSAYSMKIKNTRIKLTLNSIVSLVCVSIAVSIFTLPVYTFSFKSVSTLQLISNLLMVSVGTLCMETAGIASILCIIKLTAFGKPLMIFSGILSKALLNIAYFLSSFRYALFPLNIEYSLILIFIFLLAGGIVYLANIRNKRVLSALCVAAIIVFAGANTLSCFENFNKLRLSVANVGDGVAVVMSHKGRNIIFSCGGDYFAESEICDIMNTYGITTVDYLCLPNGYSHCKKLTDGYNVENIYCDDLKKFSDAVPLNRSVIALDGVSLGLEKNCAQIIYGNTKIVIIFSDEINAGTIDGDILIYRNEIPSCVDLDSFRFVISSSGEEFNSSKIYSVSKDGSVSLLINDDKTFKYGRVS